ncbi:MAG: short-chain dehydrogenase [Rhodospirillaceae bacterium]|nr:short-chain dehydrogenase [Rhodospirillaceae bacterium]
MIEDPKVVLVTGAAAGLGHAVALALVARDVQVGICDIDEAGAARTALDCAEIAQDCASVIISDLATPDGPDQAVREMLARFGRIDGMVNNAGYATVEAFLEMTAAAWDRTFEVNVRAVALLCAAAGKAMKVRGGGRIVNVTSPAARMALPNYAHYAASKAAVDSITRTAAIALAPNGIRVNSLAPGMMDTEMQERTERMMAEIEGRSDFEAYLDERTARVPVGVRTNTEEMAKLVLWLLLDAPDYVTAERFNGSGGLDRD